MQNVFSKDFSAPNGFVNQEADLRVFPTDVSFFREDHEAVMASRSMLRIWGGDSWPEDSFTAESNYDDLKYHVDDNQNHAAYGYMIFNAANTVCYGSIYINPLASCENTHKVLRGTAPWNESWAYVAYWIRSDVPGLEEKMFSHLSGWLEKDWPPGYLWMSRRGLSDRNTFFDRMGMRLVSEIKSAAGAPMLLYSNNSDSTQRSAT